MALLAASYVALIFLLPLGLSGWVGFRSLPRGRRCPHCGGDTFLLQSRRLARASALLPRIRLQHRWCPACAWDGAVRCLPAANRQPLVLPASPAPRAAPRAAPAGGRSDGVDLRSLQVGGAAWRVRLEFWERGSRCFGRLVFVAPDGRRRADDVRPFTGRSRSEVVGQALSLSEDNLTHRLRDLVIE